MISECMNPDCRKKLHYLRSGKVVRIISRDKEKLRVEHFWLCGRCFLRYDFCFSEDGVVTLRPRDACGAQMPLRLALVA